MKAKLIFILFLSIIIFMISCDDELEISPCIYDQPFPYSDDAPYLGIHADRQNSDRQYCNAPEKFSLSWTSMEEYMSFQPISFSEDGRSIYMTTPRVEGCKLFSINAATGEVEWCSDGFTIGITGSSAESDEDGFIYVTDGDTTDAWVISLFPDGTERWKTSIEGYGGSSNTSSRAPAGLHFTADGYIATSTVGGVVLLLERESGAILDYFDIPLETGYSSAADGGDSFPMSLVPEIVKEKIKLVIGNLPDDELATYMAISLGDSGGFSDNTIGVSSQNQLFLMGGGPDENTGSLIALKITDTGSSPELSLAWIMLLDAGSAASPSISPDGNRLVAADGTGKLFYVYVDECNSNSDGNSDPELCSAKWEYDLIGGSILASIPIDENGVIYAWNTSTEPMDTDFFAVQDVDGQPVLLWETCFAQENDTNHQWTSSATVLDNAVIGTVSDIMEVGLNIGFPMVNQISHEIVAVDRHTGQIIYSQPVPDDAVNAPAVGPDGSIYVPMMGLFDLLALDSSIEYQGGIAKYSPVQ